MIESFKNAAQTQQQEFSFLYMFFSFVVKCESKLYWPTCKLENISCIRSSEKKTVYCCFSCSFVSLNVFIFLIKAVSWKHIVLTVLIWCLVEVIFKVKIKWFYVIYIYIFFGGGGYLLRIPLKYKVQGRSQKYKLVFKCCHYQFGSRC